MTLVLPGIIASALYIISASIQYVALKRGTASRRVPVIAVGIVGLVLHGVVTVQEVYTENGINLALFPMLCLVFFAVCAMLLLSSLRRRVENLLIGIFPLAAAVILASLIAHDTYVPRTVVSQGFVWHIVLSVVAYGLLTIAALQAALLSFGDYELRHRRLGVMKMMPPLQTMEGLLFELLWAGLLFLSASIATGFIYLRTGESAAPGLIHHTVITMAAWAVFAILLWGRYQLGWRGQTASRWALSGFALLVVGYFGSKFVIEVVLTRV